MTTTPSTTHDDLLWRHLKTVPAFRGLLRAVEARFYHAIDFPGPILDVGCGDGHFVEMAFTGKIDVGIDPWLPPLRHSVASDNYNIVLQGMGDQLPFPDRTFGSAFSNSVLEHIPDVQPVLNDVGRVLKPNGRFVITMPSHRFTQNLGGAAFFERLGSPALAHRYRTFFNKISRHAHTDTAEIWAERLAQAGMVVDRWQYYFSPGALHALEIGHVQGVPAAIMRTLTGHWIVAPWQESLRPVEQWLRPFYEEPFPDDGAYLIIVARKVADGPIETRLTAPRPFTTAELAAAEPAAITPPETVTAVSPAPPTIPAPTATTAPDPALPAPAPSFRFGRKLGTAVLLAIALLAALVGQAALSDNPVDPARGGRWLLAGVGALLLLVWWQQAAPANWSAPDLTSFARRRWLLLPALLLSAFGQTLGNSGADVAALVVWLASVATAVNALWPTAPPAPSAAPASATTDAGSQRFTLLAAIALFLIALLVRGLILSQHPFILNGIEASQGLDAVRALRGSLSNPFSVAWLTNPTLPAYLQAIPIALFGQTTLAIRFWSPLIGALTVVAVFLLGTRLYGRGVGLTAAILLAGQHLHLHYSRIGMANIWDGLLMLLVLGWLALAWQQPPDRSRRTWLLAGTAVGLSAYFFTASRLLPLVLLISLAAQLVINRARLRRQWRHIAAMLLLAIVIALPQILFYRANPGIFMERFNALGILAGQTGWLQSEAASRGIDQGALLARQLWQGLLAFNTGFDQSPAYRPESTLLSFWPALLFALGLGVAVARGRQLRYLLLPVWVLITLIFGAALLLQPPNSHRLVSAAPALALLGGLALVSLAEWLLSLFTSQKSLRAYLLPALLVIAALLTLRDVGFYYGRYRQTHQFADRNTEIADRMSAYLNTLDGDWQAYFYGPPSMYVTFPNFAYQAPAFIPGDNLLDVAQDDPQPTIVGTTPTIFLILPENGSVLTDLTAQYPNGIQRTFEGYYAQPLFYVFEIRP